MARKALIFILTSLPLTLQAQVYRCDGPSSPVYSQIPCEENAEVVVIYDPVSTTAEEAAEPDPVLDAPVENVQKQPNAMQSFIATLQTQRQQQIGEIDKAITQLEKLLNAKGEQALEGPEREAAAARLAELKSARRSIVEQYASLISEAERRAGSAQSRP